MAIQELVGACQRRAFSEGSLLPTVMRNLETKRRRRGDEGSGERESAGKVDGGGSGHFTGGNS